MDARLATSLDPTGGFTVRFGDGDWLGPTTLLHGADVELRLDDEAPDVAVLSLTALADCRLARRPAGMADVGTGLRFDPSRRSGPPPSGLRAFGHQHTEFGLPTQASEDLLRWFLLPMRPPIVWPLWLCAPDGRTLLLAPLDTFHEQVISVPSDDPTVGIRWGWHGDLSSVPAGFRSRLGIFAGDSPRRLLERWAARVPRADRLAADHDTLGRSVSYWTDNGSAYWYRTEPPRSVTDTVRDAVASVEQAGIPVGAVQLDSWFYPHRSTRPFDTDEWVVPPSGLLEWEPRRDILPDGLGPLGAALGDHPLVAHCRHLSATSPYVEAFDCWVDGPYAHPTGPDYYEALLDRARSWGVETFEHDWLVECFLGVHGLRAEPGRADAWQRGIDRAAAARDMTLQWCMGTPADFATAASLPRVTSIRTCGDHGYMVGPGFLWAWFCYTNALARVLGLAPYKDVFISGSQHAEVEALLSALSTGPVGVGDAIGTTDRDVVAATCRADGVIVRPDVPIAAVDACFRTHAVARPVPLVAECHTDHEAGRWVQVFCANTYRGNETVTGSVDLGRAWPTGPTVALDLRTGAVRRPVPGWTVVLEPEEWTHTLLAPVLGAGVAVFGDVSKHAPVGRARCASIALDGDDVVVELAGAGETVTLDGWSAGSVRVRVDGALVGVPVMGGRWSVEASAGAVVRVARA